MSVPKAPIDEDDFSPAFENKIGMPRQSLNVKPVAAPEAIDYPPDCNLGRGVFGAHSGHHFRTLQIRYVVHVAAQSENVYSEVIPLRSKVRVQIGVPNLLDHSVVHVHAERKSAYRANRNSPEGRRKFVVIFDPSR
jgi:hypothetical protein